MRPITIEARTSARRSRHDRSGSNLVTYRYAAKGDRGPLTVFWYDNGLRPPTPLGVDPDDPRQRLGDGNDGLLHRRRQGRDHLRRMVGDAAPAADGAAPLVHAAAEDDPARRRPPRRLAAGLQGRHAGVQQLRLRRAAHRVRAARRAGAAHGQGPEVGRRRHEGRQHVPEAQPLIDGSYRKGWELAV